MILQIDLLMVALLIDLEGEVEESAINRDGGVVDFAIINEVDSTPIETTQIDNHLLSGNNVTLH
jgi:hypothetical protein